MTKKTAGEGKKTPVVALVAGKVGAPSKRTPEIETAILDDVARGVALVTACKNHGLGPSTFFRWVGDCPILRENYASAREAQAEFYAQEIVAISDELEVSQVTTPDGVVDFKLDAVAVARNRLRIDARKWVASKLLPKKYGDKLDIKTEAVVTHAFATQELLAMREQLKRG